MSDDATAYVYANVGFREFLDIEDGYAYVYANVGWFGVSSAIGRVVGFAVQPRINTCYVYANIEEV